MNYLIKIILLIQYDRRIDPVESEDVDLFGALAGLAMIIFIIYIFLWLYRLTEEKHNPNVIHKKNKTQFSSSNKPARLIPHDKKRYWVESSYKLEDKEKKNVSETRQNEITYLITGETYMVYTMDDECVILESKAAFEKYVKDNKCKVI